MASGMEGRGTGCSCRAWPYVQTDSSGKGKQSALGTWAQADRVTSRKYLPVRAAGARVDATKGLTNRSKHGLTFWTKLRWNSPYRAFGRWSGK